MGDDHITFFYILVRYIYYIYITASQEQLFMGFALV